MNCWEIFSGISVSENNQPKTNSTLKYKSIEEPKVKEFIEYNE
jgi:hypothetical protein